MIVMMMMMSKRKRVVCLLKEQKERNFWGRLYESTGTRFSCSRLFEKQKKCCKREELFFFLYNNKSILCATASTRNTPLTIFPSYFQPTHGSLYPLSSSFQLRFVQSTFSLFREPAKVAFKNEVKHHAGAAEGDKNGREDVLAKHNSDVL